MREQVEFGVEMTDDDALATETESSPPPVYHACLRGPNQWPDERDCPRFRADASRFADEARALSTRLTRLLALSLDLPADAFDGVFGDAPNVQMKIARYPPRMTASERRRRTDANANENDEAAAFGVGAHTDSGFLSLLLQDDVGGLQLMNGAGEWVDAPPVENTLVVNLGEMLQLATRGYYLATPHRVLPPNAASGAPAAENGTRARLSVPYFWNPRLEYVCEPMDLPPSVRWTRDRAPTAAFAARSANGDENENETEKKNVLLEAYGANALKSLARSHPEVMARHHPKLIIGDDGTVARRTSGRVGTDA